MGEFADIYLGDFYADEAARISLSAHERKPTYTGRVPLEELDDRYSIELDLSHEDIAGARRELTRIKPGLAPEDVESAVLALTAGERDEQSQASVMSTLAHMRASEIMRLTLPCECCGATPVMGNMIGLTVTAEARRKYAKSGIAMPGGHFPIPDLKHLASAKAEFKKGNHAGQDPRAIRAHINARAKALGAHGLDDDGDEDSADREAARRRPKRGQRLADRGSSEGAAGYAGAGEGGEGPGGAGKGGEMAATGKRMMVRTADGIRTIALSADQEDILGLADTGSALSTVDRIAARNPDLVQLGGSPSAFDAPGTKPYMEKAFDFDIDDTGTTRDPSPRSDPDAEVRRYLSMCKESPNSGNVSHRPKTIGQRRLAEQRELAGGRRQVWK